VVATASEHRAQILRRARLATFAIFGLNGLLLASWTARVPAVAARFGLDPGALGLLLLMVGIGSVIGLPLAGSILARLGSANTVRLAGGLLIAAMTVVAIGLLRGWLIPTGVSLFVVGFGNGVWDVAQNVEGAEVERGGTRTVMPKFHAAFSGGSFAGAMLGSLLARLGVPLWLHLLMILALGVVVVIATTRYFLPNRQPAHQKHPEPSGSRWAAWAEPRTIAIGLVVLAASLTEGSANDWLAKATVDGLHTTQSLGALLFAVFVASMTAFRFVGSRFLDRFGRVPVVRTCFLTAIIGLVIFVFAPNVYLAAAGAVIWGAGTALGFPVGMSAGADDPAHAAARVSVVSTIGYGAFLAGPPLLGLLGDHVGTRHALLAIAAVCVLSLTITPAIRRRPTSA
jgi:predicted MFS family arabinose efflux permease